MASFKSESSAALRDIRAEIQGFRTSFDNVSTEMLKQLNNNTDRIISLQSEVGVMKTDVAVMKGDVAALKDRQA